MKQSTFKQTILTKGKVKSVSGEIVVTMNYTTRVIDRYNPLTHDNFPSLVHLHKVESYVDGKPYIKALELTNENMVDSEAKKIKEKLEKHLEEMANAEPVKSFLDKMKDLGFV